MDVKVKIWEDKIFPNFDDNLVIHFETPIWNDELECEVFLEIFWKKNKHFRYKPKPIFFSTPCILHHTFENGIIIKGKLEIKKFSSFGSPDTLGIFADLYYFKKESANYIWHTEGFLISFNSKIPIIDEVEIIDCKEEIITDKAEMVATDSVSHMLTSNAYSDLFPYIYLSGWPKSSASEQLCFIYYKPFIISPPVFLFPNILASLKQANDRKGMQAEAVSFIEGKSPYEAQYVINVNTLQGHLGSFQSFFHSLNKEKNLSNIVEQTCLFFGTDAIQFSAYLKSNVYLENKEKIWESYFALIIEIGYDSENLASLIEVLTLCNFLEIVFKDIGNTECITILKNETLLSLFHATIILDKGIFPLPPYQSSPPVNSINCIFPYAIGNLQLVKYKLLRYEIGELASIINIMPGEKRKLVNRKLDRVVDKEVSKTTSISESSTANNEHNNDFNEELWNAIAETTETTNYPDPGLVSSYGPPTNITIQGMFTKTHTTQTPNKKQISSFAKKILNKTTQRLSEKVNKVRAHTELKELEDTSVSIFNNSNNKEPVYGIYYWLNKIYKAKVINYGNRMLFSFMIPNPAADYIEQTKILNDVNLQVPKSLEDFKIETYQNINENNYLQLTQYYQLKKFPLYPQQTIVVSDVVALSQSKLIDLPDSYFAYSATIEYAFGSGGPNNATVSGFLGKNTFTFRQLTSTTGKIEFKSLNNEQGKIAVSVVYNPVTTMSPPDSGVDFQMGINIICQPLPQTILEWQIEIYQLLFEAYVKMETAYYLKIEGSTTKKERINPLAERLTVKLELEKSIRKQLLQNALQVKGIPISTINTKERPDMQFNQPEIMQYLNPALEWNEMSYTFFDEYDNDSGLFSVSSLSPDFFSAFLKATYARVIIPISPEFNYGFLYFLNTGMVWSLKDSLAPCFEDSNNDKTINPDQLSIVNELKKTFLSNQYFPETIDSWEVLIPTSMQILQNKNSLKIKNHE